MSFDFVTQAATRMIKHGDIDLVKDDITVHLVYEPKRFERTPVLGDEDTERLSEIKSHLVTGGLLLGRKTFNDGVFDAADVKFSSVGSGHIGHIIVAIALVHVRTDTLVAMIQSPFVGSRFVFNGGDIVVTWDNDASKIFNIKKDLEKIDSQF